MNFLKVGFVFAIPTLIKLFAGLIIVKIFAIYLGPEGLGKLGQFLSLITMVTILAGGGIGIGIVKYIAEFQCEPKTLSSYVATASSITLSFSVLLLLVLALTAKYISLFLFQTTDYISVIYVLAFVQVVIGYGSFLMALLNGHRLVNDFAVVGVLSAILGCVGVVIGCAYFGLVGAMYGVMWFSSCQIIALLIWYHFFFKQPWRFIKPKFSVDIAKLFSRFGLMQLVSVFTMQFAQVLIRKIIEGNSSWHDVGYWQGLVKISDAYLMFITVVLSNYYMPRLSELKNKVDIIREVVAVYKIVIPTLFILALVVYFLRDFIVCILYSKDFLPISKLFFLQIVGDFFKVIAYIVAYILISKAMIKLCICAEILQSVMLVFFSLLLVNLYGLSGAVYAYVVTYVIYAGIFVGGLYIYSRKSN